MTAEVLRVLLVEDSSSDAKLVLRELQKLGRTIESLQIENAPDMRSALELNPWDLVICDWSMPKFSAPAALELLKALKCDIPFIIVSGTIGEEAAVEAMRSGAHDYVLKDRLTRLVPAIERELRERATREEFRQAERRHREAEQKAQESLRLSDAQLRQAQKMEAVGRLAGGVAHDFNNLLSVILSYCAMIANDLEQNDPIRGDIDQISEAGNRAAELTRQLLTFSRQGVVEAKVLDLNDVLANTDKMLQRILGEDIDLESLRAPDLGHIRIDPTHLEQVIMNLVVNSRDAMPTGGSLTIETKNVDLDATYAREHLGVEPGRYIMLAVTDTGIGMDQATLARIFEPFFTTKESDKGTGLGLSTVFGIVQQAAGSVWVYSEPAHGTTFKVYFPRVDAVAESVSPATAPTKLTGTETILLVEDEDQIRVLCRGILQKLGYRVLEARNSSDALHHCDNHSGTIHLLLTDVVMPRMSGPALAKHLLQARPNVKVVCMSGYPDDALIRHGGLDAGIAYLQKPITPDKLARKIRAVLDPA
jgi:signal transduction histidine kinase